MTFVGLVPTRGGQLNISATWLDDVILSIPMYNITTDAHKASVETGAISVPYVQSSSLISIYLFYVLCYVCFKCPFCF